MQCRTCIYYTHTLHVHTMNTYSGSRVLGKSESMICTNSGFAKKRNGVSQKYESQFSKNKCRAICFIIFVNFHFSVRGNNALQATVDGIEFASKNRSVSVFVLWAQVCISDLGLHSPPTPPISMLGNGVGRLRTRFHYTRPRLTRSAPFFFNIETRGAGGR